MSSSRLIAAALAAAFVLTACAGAQPANLPTATPYQATPTSGAVLSTKTPTEAAPTPVAGDAPAAPTDGERPYSSFTPEQRSSIASAPPPMGIDVSKKYIATIITAKGDIVVELDPIAAPQTVNNFVYLANNGFYDGLTFHRVEPGFVIQGGDPQGNGQGGPGYGLPPEIKLPHVDGAIAMARTGGDPATTPSSGSQFYITNGAQPNLDGQYTAFGKTIKGMEIVKLIAVGDRIVRVDVQAAGGATAKLPVVPTPKPVPASCSIIPTSVGEDDHVRGPAAAPVTIIEYADLQCPGCAALNPALTASLDSVSNTVRLVYRHFPLTTIHDKALVAAHGAEAAHAQGKFFEMVDALYAKQGEWEKTPATAITATLKTIAAELKLDVAKFETDLASAAVAARVKRDIDSGTVLNVSGTPSLYIDGQSIPQEAFGDPNFATQLREYAARRQATASTNTGPALNVADAEKVTESGAIYEITIKTSQGDVVAELDPALAPVNANSVLFLIGKGYYNNTPVQQNFEDPGAVVMGSASAQGNPGYDCGSEATNSDFTTPGMLALNPVGAPNRNGASLVMVYKPADRLNKQLTAIGKITKGLEIVQKLKGPEGATPGDSIVTITAKKK